MKTVFISLIISILLVVACTQKTIEAASANLSMLSTVDILGQWKFKGYADRKLPIYEITIEFKEEEGNLTLNGRSSVNFYFANYEANKATKSFKVGVLGSTKIAGSLEANQFESMYYEHLRNVNRYDFKDKNTLTLFLSNPKNEEMHFERK